MALKMALTIAGGYLAVAQGLSMILTETMTALILGVATPFLVLGGCVAYVLERETRPEFPASSAWRWPSAFVERPLEPLRPSAFEDAVHWYRELALEGPPDAPHRTAPRVIDVPPRRFRKAA
jgi:hypothetical protein